MRSNVGGAMWVPAAQYMTTPTYNTDITLNPNNNGVVYGLSAANVAYNPLFTSEYWGPQLTLSLPGASSLLSAGRSSCFGVRFDAR